MKPPTLCRPTNLNAPGAVDALLAFHRATFGDARMEEGAGAAGGASGGAEGAGSGSSAQGGSQPAGGATGGQNGGNPDTLTKAQADALVAEAAGKAKNQAAEDLAKELGMPLADAKALLKSAKQKADAQKTEDQRAREAAESEANTAKATAEQARADAFAALADRALLAAGAPDNDEGLARLRGLLQVKPGATKDEIKADVKKVTEQFPVLFGEASGGQRRVPGSDPKGRGGQRGSGPSAIERGAARAKSRYAGGRPDAATEFPIKIPGLG